MSYLCNRNRETKIDNNKVPWMSGLVSGLQNRVRRFESDQEPQTAQKAPIRNRSESLLLLSISNLTTLLFY